MVDKSSRPGMHDELHLVLVRALGTDIDALTVHLRAAFATFGFATEVIKLSNFIAELQPDLIKLLDQRGSYEYYKAYMDAGDKLRNLYGEEVLAFCAIKQVQEKRNNYVNDIKHRGIIFIHDSVMHPAEAATFRQTYGNLTFLISINRSASKRRQQLDQKFRGHGMDPTKVPLAVDELMERDMGHGQIANRRLLSFERTFHHADIFLDGDMNDCSIEENGESTQPVIKRFIRQLFSYPHGTPTIEENMMAHAVTASLQSGALSRRVGVAIRSRKGDLLAVGRNDVPRAHGGLYNSNDPEEMGDAKYAFNKQSFPILDEDIIGADSNDLVKLEMLLEIFNIASKEGIVTITTKKSLLEKLLDSSRIRQAQFFEQIAYGRTVHAEMDAITTAARTGRDVKGAQLYTTTFPCHECARHIVASGIREVVYIEPYPKSRVKQLHADSVQLIDDTTVPADEKFVTFRPFVGIGPRRLAELYSLEDRKMDDPLDLSTYGYALSWTPKKSARLRRSIAGDGVVPTLIRAAVQMAERMTGDAIATISAVAKNEPEGLSD